VSAAGTDLAPAGGGATDTSTASGEILHQRLGEALDKLNEAYLQLDAHLKAK
jgi:hypothetical protein